MFIWLHHADGLFMDLRLKNLSPEQYVDDLLDALKAQLPAHAAALSECALFRAAAGHKKAEGAPLDISCTLASAGLKEGDWLIVQSEAFPLPPPATLPLRLCRPLTPLLCPLPTPLPLPPQSHPPQQSLQLQSLLQPQQPQ